MRLASLIEAAHIGAMTALSTRSVAVLCVVGAAAALGIALASEAWGGLVPCALCLWERWPYRLAIVLGLLAGFLPPRYARIALLLAVLAILTDAAFAFIHVGVELHYWPSPLPECAAPRFSGGSIAQRLAQMPLAPAKPCDDPTYLIPWLPISMAGLNLLYSLAFALLLGILLRYSRGRTA